MQFFAYVNHSDIPWGRCCHGSIGEELGPDNSARAKGVAARRMMKPRKQEGKQSREMNGNFAREPFVRSTEFAVGFEWKGFRMVRILLVDDNPAVRRYLRAILEQQESWQVCGEARTGAEALHQVLEAPPDLILLDYQMPDLNGVDVAKTDFRALSQDSHSDGDATPFEPTGGSGSSGGRSRSLREAGHRVGGRSSRGFVARQDLFSRQFLPARKAC